MNIGNESYDDCRVDTLYPKDLKYVLPAVTNGFEKVLLPGKIELQERLLLFA